MRCEYMVDGQVQFDYAHSRGNPLSTERIRLYRSAISADEELELAFRTFGEFQRFVKFLQSKMWEQVNIFKSTPARDTPRRKRGR